LEKKSLVMGLKGLDAKMNWLAVNLLLLSNFGFNFDFELNQLWDIRQPVRTITEDIIKIRYQETTSEDIEVFTCVAVTVIFRVCKPVRLL
jgi:hypothetical protein